MRILALAVLLLAAPAAWGQTPAPWDVAKKAAGGATTAKLEKTINKKLLEEGRKNQCSFKTDQAVLEPGCDAKMKRLSNALVDAKKRLNGAGVKNFTFVVSGHTDTTGSAQRNEALSGERAEVIRKELVQRGVAANEIESVGMGSKKPVVKPDDTPAKRAKNRRYEIQVKL
jgi:OmpA-OmpF porin, OOP family